MRLVSFEDFGFGVQAGVIEEPLYLCVSVHWYIGRSAEP